MITQKTTKNRDTKPLPTPKKATTIKINEDFRI